RVFLAASFPTFAFFYALDRILRLKRFIFLPLLAIPAGALALAQSRLHLAVMGVVTVAYVLGLTGALPRRLLLAGFFLVALVFMLSVPFPDFNPYRLFSGDGSAEARARALTVFRFFISEYPIFGVGISPTRADETSLLRASYIYWDDLGVIGVWYCF